MKKYESIFQEAKNKKDVKELKELKEKKDINTCDICNVSINGLDSRLIQLREQHGLSQEKVSEYLGINRASYAHYESCENNKIPIIRVYQLSELYNVPIDYLVKGESYSVADELWTIISSYSINVQKKSILVISEILKAFENCS